MLFSKKEMSANSTVSNQPIVTEMGLVSFHQSRIHGMGGFARMDIAAGTQVIEYAGERITKHESLRRCEAGNEYIFALDDEHDLDGSLPSNPARFLNHSCEPNCEVKHVEDHLWIVAKHDIRTEEELTFNYGYDLENYREYPCRCGAADCVRYIVSAEFFDHVRQLNRIALESAES